MCDDDYQGERYYYEGITWQELEDYHECPCGCRYAWVDCPDSCPWPRPAPFVPDPSTLEGKLILLYQRTFIEQIERDGSLMAFFASGKSAKDRRTRVRRS